MPKSRQIFTTGFRHTLVFQSGVIPFGILYATLAVQAAFPWWLVLIFSVVVFAGSSQLVFINLLTTVGSPFQAFLGSNFVNMRHLIYSAAISKELSNFSKGWRLVLGYLLTDQMYAISETKKSEIQKYPMNIRRWYYFGSGFCTWFFWQLSTALGIFLGPLVPTSWNLDFAIPLMFMPMMIKVCKNKFSYYTTLLSALFVFIFQKIPFGLGLFAAIICASFAGLLLEKRLSRGAN